MVSWFRRLLHEVWDPGSNEPAHCWRNYLHHLRHTLAADPARPVYLSTEAGVGYPLKYQE